MRRSGTTLLGVMIVVSSLVGCLGGEEFDTSAYESEIAELEEMLEMQNQTIAQRDATIDGLESGMANATQMIQAQADGIAILEAYRNSLVTQIAESNNSSADLNGQLERANASIASLESNIASLETLLENANASIASLESNIASLETLLENANNSSPSSDSTVDELQALLIAANYSIQQLEAHLIFLEDEVDDWKYRAVDRFLGYANLSHGDYRYSNLSHAYIEDTNLSHSDLSFANLSYANLMYSNLSWTNLQRSEMQYADLHAANLGCAILYDTNLTGADLSYAVVSHASCIFTWDEVDLSHADLSYANLSNLHIEESNLSHADLTHADLTGVSWDDTICPDGTNSDDNGNTCENNLLI
ncbi:MAG: pentapeptide repeat-containing protein [Candidatus Thermoplasmatota archaeon]|nr:pentapeptide repeat-containing protein [Candidatus Thermoplasmatota archaeon]